MAIGSRIAAGLPTVGRTFRGDRFELGWLRSNGRISRDMWVGLGGADGDTQPFSQNGAGRSALTRSL